MVVHALTTPNHPERTAQRDAHAKPKQVLDVPDVVPSPALLEAMEAERSKLHRPSRCPVEVRDGEGGT